MELWQVLVQFYSRFLGRDLTYMAGGGFFIASIQYARSGRVDFLYEERTAVLGGWLAFSYVLGLVLSEFGNYSGIIPKRQKGEYPSREHRGVLDRLFFWTPRTGTGVAKTDEPDERTAFLVHVGSAMGMASLASTLAWAAIHWLGSFLGVAPLLGAVPHYWLGQLGLVLLTTFLVLYCHQKRVEGE